jgi:hypothetical protein
MEHQDSYDFSFPANPSNPMTLLSLNISLCKTCKLPPS